MPVRASFQKQTLRDMDQQARTGTCSLASLVTVQLLSAKQSGGTGSDLAGDRGWVGSRGPWGARSRWQWTLTSSLGAPSTAFL